LQILPINQWKRDGRAEETNDRWYALKVRSRFESIVARNSTVKGYDVFLPTYMRKSEWSDRFKTDEYPLFPGYLFCRFDIQQPLPILLMPGVQFIVGAGSVPEPIPELQIQALRRVIGCDTGYEPHAYLAAGQRVRITCGALRGLTGQIIQTKVSCLLVISVNLLRRGVAVNVEQAWLEPVDAVNFVPTSAVGRLI
jgi:transcription antitermination factor NusG